MKLTLVNPRSNRPGMIDNESQRFPPLGLASIAALTPSHWEVELIDESLPGHEFRGTDADLVAITAFTSMAPRAYEIAAECRLVGIPAVMGGPHATVCPNEALQYADYVITGEAELAWKQFLLDFESRDATSLYHGIPTAIFVRPDRCIFRDRYKFASIQTSRGCPHDCDFCSVSSVFGRKYRRQPVDQVIEDLLAIPAHSDRMFVVDDNFAGYGPNSRRECRHLLKRMISLGWDRPWFCQCDISICDDAETLELMGQAGCLMIFLGIEAEPKYCGGLHKAINQKYTLDFSKVHHAGMAVLGSFIFGLPDDSPQAVYDRTDWIMDSGVDAIQITLATPLPGTRMYRDLLREGRIQKTNYPADWANYDFLEMVFCPSGFPSLGAFRDVLIPCMKQAFDPTWLKEKGKRTMDRTGSQNVMFWAYRTNQNHANIAQHMIERYEHMTL